MLNDLDTLVGWYLLSSGLLFTSFGILWSPPSKETLNINTTEDKPFKCLSIQHWQIMPPLSGQSSTAVIPFNFVLKHNFEPLRCIKRDNSASLRTLSGLISPFPVLMLMSLMDRLWDNPRDVPGVQLPVWNMGVPAIYSWHISAGCYKDFHWRRHLGCRHATCVMWWHNMANPACLLYRACSDAGLQRCNTELFWQISQTSTYHHRVVLIITEYNVVLIITPAPLCQSDLGQSSFFSQYNNH